VLSCGAGGRNGGGGSGGHGTGDEASAKAVHLRCSAGVRRLHLRASLMAATMVIFWVSPSIPGRGATAVESRLAARVRAAAVVLSAARNMKTRGG